MFEMGNITNEKGGTQVVGNAGENYITIDHDKNYGTVVFDLQNLNAPSVEASMFDMGNIKNEKSGTQAVGNAGNNYIKIGTDKNYGTVVFTLI